MKKFLVTVLVLLCLGFGACAALQLTGRVDFKEYLNKEEASSEAAFYVSFMDDFFVMDEEGVVLECVSAEPSDIPEITNLRFSSLIIGQEAETESASAFGYVQEVCSLLDTYGVSVLYISAEDGELELYLTETLSVELGKNDDTALKIKDLKSMYSMLIEYDGGVLYMTSADTSGQGYTFKEISDEEDDEDSDENSGEEESETATDSETEAAAETEVG